MNTYLILFALSMFVSVALTPIVRRICERYELLDHPHDERRVHKKAVPRLGGIAIYATVLVSLASLSLFDNFLTQSLREARADFLTLLVPGTVIFLFGVYDDLRGVPVRYKFIVQAGAGLLLYAMGGRIEILSVPFVGGVELPIVISCVLTVFWVVGITNAFNLIDGMDGLAAGAALFASLVMLTVSLIFGNPFVTVMSVVLAGALIGFLRYNFNPASIFLGDSGSLFVGFTLAALSVQGALKASTALAVAIPVLAFGLPILDTGLALIRRFISGRPVFEADREHIHHMLLARGWSQRRVALVLYAVCASFGLMALLFVNEERRTTGFALFVIGVAVLFAVNRLRFHEVDEVKAGVKRKMMERRLRTANNIHIRRASRLMGEVETLGALFGTIGEMLKNSGFAHAEVCLWNPLNRAANEVAFESEENTTILGIAELRGGLIHWSWRRYDDESFESSDSSHSVSSPKSSDLTDSAEYWSLRLPLSTPQGEWGYINFYSELNGNELLLDINYLCNLFQKELSFATERLLTPGTARKVDAGRTGKAHQPIGKAVGGLSN